MGWGGGTTFLLVMDGVELDRRRGVVGSERAGDDAGHGSYAEGWGKRITDVVGLPSWSDAQETDRLSFGGSLVLSERTLIGSS
jgi:hypothetical protein